MASVHSSTTAGFLVSLSSSLLPGSSSSSSRSVSVLSRTRAKRQFDQLPPSMQYRYLQSVNVDERLSVRCSRIHGQGLFANVPLAEGEVRTWSSQQDELKGWARRKKGGENSYSPPPLFLPLSHLCMALSVYVYLPLERYTVEMREREKAAMGSPATFRLGSPVVVPAQASRSLRALATGSVTCGDVFVCSKHSPVSLPLSRRVPKCLVVFSTVHKRSSSFMWRCGARYCH